jgi:hypothetical protein
VGDGIRLGTSNRDHLVTRDSHREAAGVRAIKGTNAGTFHTHDT